MSFQFNDGLSHERRTSMPAIAISIEVVTTVLLWIRIGSRFSMQSSFGLDDALIILAWIVGVGVTVAVLLGTEIYGLNRHIWDVPPRHFPIGGLIGFIVEVLFFWSTCFTKVSVLLFYRRLVQGTVGNKFKYAIWAAITFVVAYSISFTVVILVDCMPVQAIWLRYDYTGWAAKNDFNCHSHEHTTKIAKLIGALSVVTDFYSVLLPAALVLQIRISRRQAIGLLFIFGIGMLVVGAGIARTYYLGRVFVEEIDKTWWTWHVFLASIIECNVAIVCACAPSLRACFGRYFKSPSTSLRGYYKKGSANSSANESEHNRLKHARSQSMELIASIDRPVESAMSMRGQKDLIKDTNSVPLQPYQYSYQEGTTAEMNSRSQPPRIRTLSPVSSPNTDIHPFPRPQSMPFGLAPGSFLASPTPSNSSDDEVTLVAKSWKHHNKAGLD